MIDYYYTQNLLPHKFSQIGPCMQEGDLDGDGVDFFLEIYSQSNHIYNSANVKGGWE